jgi:xylan 1,4-beta-xylosidase
MVDRRTFIQTASVAALAVGSGVAQGTSNAKRIDIDLRSQPEPFPHYWEECAGSDRTAVAFRAQWQQDLIRARELTGFKAVRCHGLFDDEMGVCRSIGQNGPVFNFLYVAEVFDKLLEIGVKPFVELGFMPLPMASSRNTVFWYKGNTSPPAKMEYWSQLISTFTAFCVKRYGISEVSKWDFECWNEPDLGFWSGQQSDYFELYKATALAVKSVDQRIRVGGPATAEVQWVPAFTEYCATHKAPVDFVSTHIYPTDPQTIVFGREAGIPVNDVMPRAIAQARDQIRSSKLPKLPLLITEWSSQNPAFIGQTLRDCAGLTENLSYWTFSNVFEEGGPASQFYNGTFGMIGQRGVARPSLHAMTLAHRLGEKRLSATDGPVLATQRADGSRAILGWNLLPTPSRQGFGGAGAGGRGAAVDPVAQAKSQMAGSPLSLTFRFPGLAENTRARVTSIDMLKGSSLLAYQQMGSPEYPNTAEVLKLRDAAVLPAAEEHVIRNGELTIELPPTGLALVEIAK